MSPTFTHSAEAVGYTVAGPPAVARVSLLRAPGGGMEIWLCPQPGRLWMAFPWGYSVAVMDRAAAPPGDGGGGRLLVAGPGDAPSLMAKDGVGCVVVLGAALVRARVGGDSLAREIAGHDLGATAMTGIRQACARVSRLEPGQSEAAIAEACAQALTLLLPLLRAGDRGRAEDPAVRRARLHLQQRYHERITLDHLAGLTGISKFHLERRFAHAHGLGAHALLRRIRIGRALQRLRGAERCRDVATAVGFADQPHMTRAFRQELGVTPARYARDLAVSDHGDDEAALQQAL